MESVLTYVLQVNLLLAIVFLGYVLLLRKLTFYRLNRVYLLIGGVYALVYPFLDITNWFRSSEVLPIDAVWEYVEYYLPEQVVEVFSVGHLLLVVFGIGAIVLLLKLSIQLLSLMRIHRYSKPSRWKDYFFRNVMFPIVPFSFFNKIYVHQEQHDNPELQDIFKHEDIHVKGLHTIDILLFEMLLIGCWYNPFVWLMRRAVRQNLEFLTDQQVLDKGVDRQTYQYSLLTVTKQGAAVGIGNQFNFKTLKRRIMMMNKRRSSRMELSKYAFLLPIVIFAGATFTVSKAEGKIEELVERIKEIPVDVVLPIVHKDTTVAPALGLELSPDAVPFLVGTEDTTKKTANILLHNGSSVNRLFILDGKILPSNFDLNTIDPNTIESISVFKGEDAISKYGDRAKDGVIELKSKADRGAEEVKGQVLGLRIGATEASTSVGAKALLRNATGNSGVKPLILVDGEVMRDGFDLNKLNAGDIESVSVLKDKPATSLYGERGKNGVILITAKRGSVTQRLYGKVPSSNPVDSIRGGLGNIIIRGVNPTYGSKAKPLIIVDGEVMGEYYDTSSLKPEDIHSISVLKEASAEKLYGPRGRNGVLVVTTKPYAYSVSPTKGDTTLFVKGAKGNSGTFVVGKSVTTEGGATTLSKARVFNLPAAGLFVVDGVVQKSSFDIDTIPIESIESVTLLKNNEAQAAYGELAKDGVIKVVTKKGNN
ncbi:MAG: TonB-dependent receptor plug domain-containing protein [Sphingobacterium sp.]|jgi:TonB-dependent SusC/RagA subfamily outer membrane receptor|nr:TonB-dependent receptor plug domain-containing protein [Sphingobacterium sp.]